MLGTKRVQPLYAGFFVRLLPVHLELLADVEERAQIVVSEIYTTPLERLLGSLPQLVLPKDAVLSTHFQQFIVRALLHNGSLV